MSPQRNKTILCSGNRVYADPRHMATARFPIVLACGPKHPEAKSNDCDLTLEIDATGRAVKIARGPAMIRCSIDKEQISCTPRLPSEVELQALSASWDLSGDDFWILILDQTKENTQKKP